MKSNFRRFLPLEKIRGPMCGHPHSHPQVQSTHCLSGFALMDISDKWNQTRYGLWSPSSSMRIMCLGFLCIAACVGTSFLSVAEQHSCVWMYHSVLSIPRLTSIWVVSSLGRLWIVLLRGNGVRDSVWSCVFISCGEIPRQSWNLMCHSISLSHLSQFCVVLLPKLQQDLESPDSVSFTLDA